jgi:hypothetical protein
MNRRLTADDRNYHLFDSCGAAKERTMNTKLTGWLIVGLALSGTLVIQAQSGLTPIEIPPIPVIQISPIQIFPIGIGSSELLKVPANSHAHTPLNLIGVMPLPAPSASTDLLWVDQPSGRLFLADRTNRSVDMYDTGHDVFIGRVPGFFGVVGGAVTSQGPNGLLVTPDNKLWVADGMATLRVADLNVNPPVITQSFTVGPATDGRADEIAYDPVDHLIAVGFDAARPPYVAIISADTYTVAGKIPFPDAEGMEQPVWDGQLSRFIINVPGSPRISR